MPKVVGKGWGSVLVAKVPTPAPRDRAGAGDGPDAKADRSVDQLMSVVGLMPKVSGSWGSGRLMAGAAFSVLLTDDGRIVAGAVTPEALYAAVAGS